MVKLETQAAQLLEWERAAWTTVPAEVISTQGYSSSNMPWNTDQLVEKKQRLQLAYSLPGMNYQGKI